jgi:hypothetical protein
MECETKPQKTKKMFSIDGKERKNRIFERGKAIFAAIAALLQKKINEAPFIKTLFSPF